MKKPFNQTKLGQFLASKGFDNVLEAVGTVVPGVKVLDLVKDMVVGPNAKRVLAPNDRDEFLRLLDAEQTILEIMANDTMNARNREIEIKKLGGKDYMQSVVTIFFLACFTTILIKHLFFPGEIKGFAGYEELIKNVLMIIAGYHFGSSSGSRMKNKFLSPKDE
jgi:hypothetical protein